MKKIYLISMLALLGMTQAFSSWAMSNTIGEHNTTLDVNGDNEVTIADVSSMIDLLMVRGSNIVGDINNDNEVNIADINALIDIILNGYVDPHNSGYWLLTFDKEGQPLWCELMPNDYGDYSTVISLKDPIFGEIWDSETNERNFVPFYVKIDGVMYGAEQDNQEASIGWAQDNPLIPSHNSYVIPMGFNYSVGVIHIEGKRYFYVAQHGWVSN